MAKTEDDSGGRAAVKGQRAGSGYDVGLHAKDALGTFDVGLAVEGVPGAGESLGVYIQAPRVGRLRVAFAVTPEGVTRLAALERRDDDGLALPTAGLLAIDEGRIRRLEAQVQRYEEALAKLELERDEAASARDEARDRAAALGEERKDLKGKLEAARENHAAALSKAENAVDGVRSELPQEKDLRVAALAEREKVRGELETLREELEGGTAKLSHELSEAREKLSALQSERDAMVQKAAETAGVIAEAEELRAKIEEQQA